MTTKTNTDPRDLVSEIFCNFLQGAEPTISRANDNLGINIFVGGAERARITLKGDAQEIVGSSINTIGTLSLNIQDESGHILNASMATNDDGEHFPTSRVAGSWWCCALVETKIANASQLAVKLRKKSIMGLSLSDALDYAKDNNEDAAQALLAVQDYVQNSGDAAKRVFGKLRETHRYDLSKMLVLFERSGAPNVEGTVWTNVAKSNFQPKASALNEATE
mgnify:CR=1 FL=1